MATPTPAGGVRPGGAPPAGQPGIPKPAPAPAVAPAAVGQGAGQAQQVSAVRKTGFLSALRPTRASEAKPTNCVLVIGNRGCKTVAAVAVDTADGKSPNGRVDIRATPGLPSPPGSRNVIITFDNQTSQSLLNHYGDMLQGASDAEIYHIMDPVYEYEADGTTVKSVLYPGWDGGSAESGVIVSAAFKELLTSLKSSADVGRLIIDKYDTFISTVAKYLAYRKANMPLDNKLEMSQWTARSNLLNDVDFLVRTTPMKGGWVVATGSRDLKDGDEKLTFADGGKNVKKQVVPANWQEKVHSEWPNVIQVYKLALSRGGFTWEAEVEEGRHPIFPLGAKVDITGRHIGAFQVKELLKFPAEEEPAPRVAPAASQAQPGAQVAQRR
jgi:hypothetical protein